MSVTGLLTLGAAWTAIAILAGLALATAVRRNTTCSNTRKENQS